MELPQEMAIWPAGLDDPGASQAIRRAPDPRTVAELLVESCLRLTGAEVVIASLDVGAPLTVTAPPGVIVADPPGLHADAAAHLSLPADGAAALRLALERGDGSRLGVVEIRSPAAFDAEVMRTISALVELSGEVFERLLDRADRELAAGQLRHAQRIEAVGQLAGGVAHDFNNLLTAMMGYAELALRATDPNSGVARDLEELVATAKSGAQLTNQLLAFSRRQPLELSEVDINDAVLKVVPLLNRLIGDGVSLTTSLMGAPCVSVVDRGQLEQALVNLVVNARDAVEGRGDVRIETGREDVVERRVASDGSIVEPGSYAVLAVHDGGCGIEPALLASIFEPFFTTKPTGKGTGLGLAMAHSTVVHSGGAIDVRSTVGSGTTFRILLPFTDASDRVRSVLLVEDEAGIRSLLRRLLEDAGWQVVEARDGQEAMALAADMEHLDLLLTDIGLPRLPGTAVAEQLRQQRETLPVVFISGFPEDPPVEALGDNTAFLPKPFTGDDLLAAIERLVPRRAGSGRGAAR
ncbi:MAG TPA: ATP-binding protein [Acidimicrobiales bacterium]|nr:ATP-binding protein [Acidimicrobiales bacterium]